MPDPFEDLLSGLVDSAANAAREPGAEAAKKRGRQRRNRRRVAASTLSVALLGVLGGVAALNVPGSNGSPAAPDTGTHSAVPVTSAPSTTPFTVLTPSPAITVPSTRAAAPPSTQGSATGSESPNVTVTQNSTAGGSAASCTNADVTVAFGHGATNGNYQSTDLIFTNVGSGTCTLQGYPGAALVAGSTTINATRELNEFMGDTHLTSPPLVTLAPGGTASATLQWLLPTAGQTCPYPAATGSIEIIAPDTTHVDIVSTGAHVGRDGICSSLEIDPVTPGTARPPT
jgi:hypothetical protein